MVILGYVCIHTVKTCLYECKGSRRLELIDSLHDDRIWTIDTDVVKCGQWRRLDWTFLLLTAIL